MVTTAIDYFYYFKLACVFTLVFFYYQIASFFDTDMSLVMLFYLTTLGNALFCSLYHNNAPMDISFFVLSFVIEIAFHIQLFALVKTLF